MLHIKYIRDKGAIFRNTYNLSKEEGGFPIGCATKKEDAELFANAMDNLRRLVEARRALQQAQAFLCAEHVITDEAREGEKIALLQRIEGALKI